MRWSASCSLPTCCVSLDLSAFLFGLVGAAGGVGAVVGATVTTWVGRRLGTGRTIILCHLVTTLGVVAMVVAGQEMAPAATVAAIMVGQGLYGLAMGMSNSHEMSYRQLVTPDELQARTNTTLRAFNRAVVVIVAPVAGILADAWGHPADAGAGGRHLRVGRRRARCHLLPQRARPGQRRRSRGRPLTASRSVSTIRQLRRPPEKAEKARSGSWRSERSIIAVPSPAAAASAST